MLKRRIIPEGPIDGVCLYATVAQRRNCAGTFSSALGWRSHFFSLVKSTTCLLRPESRQGIYLPSFARQPDSSARLGKVQDKQLEGFWCLLCRWMGSPEHPTSTASGRGVCLRDEASADTAAFRCRNSPISQRRHSIPAPFSDILNVELIKSVAIVPAQLILHFSRA